ncbi:heat shock factor 2-binding protein [Nematostella vectensis]|uniref:heat shock factor 2-binding protein n=1 Tax=Nematostella vectensis TaxID=45351 RepID=UPI00207798FC|nr:heat shock factor 2-binding protein [Nematostella vectensis]
MATVDNKPKKDISMEYTSSKLPEKYVKIKKSELDGVFSEVRQLKQFVPKIVDSEFTFLCEKVEARKIELEKLQKENNLLKREIEHIKNSNIRENNVLSKKYNNLMNDYDKEREEKFQLKCQLTSVNQSLLDQSEYCASMGAAACTLLWRVSRQQDSVSSLLAGTKAEEFLEITTKTLDSYFATCDDSDTDQEKSEEFQFVLALCGIVTNLAAAPCGRDFLVTNSSGQGLVDTLVRCVEETRPSPNVRIHSLVLMALYNVSIHRNGLQHLLSRPTLLSALMRLISDEISYELRLNGARLLQSMVMEPENLSQYALQQISLPSLQRLATTVKGEVQSVLLDIVTDLQRHQDP